MRKLILFCLLTGPAFAGTATLNWTNATTCTDGTPMLTGCPITAAKIEYVSSLTCTATTIGSAPLSVTVPGTGTTVTIVDLAAGSWCRVLTSFEDVCATVLADHRSLQRMKVPLGLRPQCWWSSWPKSLMHLVNWSSGAPHTGRWGTVVWSQGAMWAR